MTRKIAPTLDMAHDSERALLRATGTERHQPAFSVYRSERFPGFFDGNCLVLRNAPIRNIAGWERTFRAYFDQRYRHVSMFALDGSGAEQLFDDARERGYQITRLCYLRATTAPPVSPLPTSMTIRTIDTAQRWQMSAEFDDRQNRPQPWYTPEGQAMLYARKRLVSEASGITWKYVSPRDDDRILSQLGMFAYDGRSGRGHRLQEMVTAPDHRRQGLARALLTRAMNDACTAGDSVFLCADTDYFAIDLYRDLGFVDVGGLTRLFLPPS